MGSKGLLLSRFFLNSEFLPSYSTDGAVVSNSTTCRIMAFSLGVIRPFWSPDKMSGPWQLERDISIETFGVNILYDDGHITKKKNYFIALSVL